MSGIPSNRMFTERPPTAEETFRRLVGESGAAFAPRRRADSVARPMVAGPSLTSANALPTRASASAAGEAPLAQAPAASQVAFREIYSTPENQIFKVVFF